MTNTVILLSSFLKYRIRSLHFHLGKSVHNPIRFTRAKLLQLCPTLWDPMACSLPGSAVHGISQAAILQWVAMSTFRGAPWPRDRTHVSEVSCPGGSLPLALRGKSYDLHIQLQIYSHILLILAQLHLQLSFRVFKFNLFTLHSDILAGNQTRHLSIPWQHKLLSGSMPEALACILFLPERPFFPPYWDWDLLIVSSNSWLKCAFFLISQKNPYAELILPFSDCPHYFVHTSTIAFLVR